jgi:hypothetical protein
VCSLYTSIHKKQIQHTINQQLTSKKQIKPIETKNSRHLHAATSKLLEQVKTPRKSQNSKNKSLRHGNVRQANNSQEKARSAPSIASAIRAGAQQQQCIYNYQSINYAKVEEWQKNKQQID